MSQKNNMKFKQKLLEFKKDYLKGKLELCTLAQQEFFYESVYPNGVPDSELESAIALVERTIDKNGLKK
jgi:hypothetical protein